MRYEVEEALFLHSQGVHRSRIAQMLGMAPSTLHEYCDRAGVHLDTWEQARTRKYVNRILESGGTVRFSTLPEWVDRRLVSSIIKSGIANGTITVTGSAKRINHAHSENVYQLAKVVSNVA